MQQAIPIRTKIQLGIYSVINPVVRLLIRLGLTPNMVTTIGLLLNVGVAAVFIAGGQQGNRGDLSYVGWAGRWCCLPACSTCSTGRWPGWVR